MVAVLLIAVSTLPRMRSGVSWKLSALPLLFYCMNPDSTLKRASDLQVLDENELVEIARILSGDFKRSNKVE